MGSHGSSEASYEASFIPMNMASLADMTRKLAFLLALASAKGTVKCGPSALMYTSGKIAASEVSAFRAVLHFRQAVVSAKKCLAKNDGPEYPFRRLLCAFIWGTQVIYPSRKCQGGSYIWSHKAYSEGQDDKGNFSTSERSKLANFDTSCPFIQNLLSNFSSILAWSFPRMVTTNYEEKDLMESF